MDGNKILIPLTEEQELKLKGVVSSVLDATDHSVTDIIRTTLADLKLASPEIAKSLNADKALPKDTVIFLEYHYNFQQVYADFVPICELSSSEWIMCRNRLMDTGSELLQDDSEMWREQVYN